MDEVEDVLLNGSNEMVRSRNSDNFVVFGYTGTDRYIAVVVELIDDNPKTLYPVTAYEAPAPREM